MGRGPTENRPDILRIMIIGTLRALLSQAEKNLAISKKGMTLIKKLWQQMVEQG